MSIFPCNATGVNSSTNASTQSFETMLPLFFQEFEKIKQKFQQYESRMDEIQQLQIQITNLQDRNAELELENRRLRDLLEHQDKSNIKKGLVTPLFASGATNVASPSDSAVNAATIDNAPHVPLGTQASSWAVVARRNNKKKQAPKPRTIESAARGFQPVTGPTGFVYVYIP